MQIDLSGQICLVTGASRGIGEAIAQALGSAGATVVGTATSESGAQAIGGRLNEAGITGTGLCLDVCSAKQVTAVVQAVEAQFGAPTVLVNNAGITRDGLLMRMTPEQWDAVINTNLTAVYRTCQACLRGMMKARYGRIINLSSVVSASGNPGQSNYAAAKSGLAGFGKSLAREVASRGITVNAVAPGFIETDMTRALDESQKTALLSNIPLGRMGQAAEVAAAVAYLASRQAGYITGTTLHINGGLYLD